MYLSDYKQFLSKFEYLDALLVTLKYNNSVWCNFIYYCKFFSIWSSEAVSFSSHTRWSSCTKVLFTFHRTVQLFHYILWFSVKRLTQELLIPWQKKRILTLHLYLKSFGFLAYNHVTNTWTSVAQYLTARARDTYRTINFFYYL